MLKTIKDIRIFGIILVAILIMFMTAAYLDNSGYDNESYLEVGAYFLNPATNMLERETRTLLKGTNEEMIYELLNDILIKGPLNSSLAKTVPEFVTFLRGELSENRFRLQLEFVTDGDIMTPEEELFFKSSLCWTMTELPMVTDLHIYINTREMLRADGRPVGPLNRENVKIDQPFSPFKTETYRVLLYFSDSDYLRLIPEERVIPVKTSSPNQDMAKDVVEQLIAGPSLPEHFATIPPETSIREVSTDGDICYVNLSADVFLRTMAPDGDMRLTIYSMVNSLTELDDIKRVQFLVDSKRVEMVGGGHDLSLPIERDEALILIGDHQ